MQKILHIILAMIVGCAMGLLIGSIVFTKIIEVEVPVRVERLIEKKCPTVEKEECPVCPAQKQCPECAECVACPAQKVCPTCPVCPEQVRQDILPETEVSTLTSRKKEESITSNYKNCTELRRDYPNGVDSSHSAYRSKFDRDKDGFACEK